MEESSTKESSTTESSTENLSKSIGDKFKVKIKEEENETYYFKKQNSLNDVVDSNKKEKSKYNENNLHIFKRIHLPEGSELTLKNQILIFYDNCILEGSIRFQGFHTFDKSNILENTTRIYMGSSCKKGNNSKFLGCVRYQNFDETKPDFVDFLSCIPKEKRDSLKEKIKNNL